MKGAQLSVLAVLLILSQRTYAWDFFGKNKNTYLNQKEDSRQAIDQTQVLQTLQQDMTTRFQEIESELASGNSQKALAVAKSVLDTVRVKTGIDPKNKIQEKFLIATKFPANAKSMADLSEEQKELVIRTISDYRGGLYLDIMNLSKRTTLLYINAFQAQLSKAGGLTKEDEEKIVNDLVKASLVPMPVEDKSRTKIIVFDEDVANEDHTYLFNRELKMFLLKNEEFQISESVFEEKRAALKAGYVGDQKKNNINAFNQGIECMNDADKISWAEPRVKAKVSCFDKFFNETIDFNECHILAKRLEWAQPINIAQVKCFNKFN